LPDTLNKNNLYIISDFSEVSLTTTPQYPHVNYSVGDFDVKHRWEIKTWRNSPLSSAAETRSQVDAEHHYKMHCPSEVTHDKVMAELVVNQADGEH